jgi:hypothetical protein
MTFRQKSKYGVALAITMAATASQAAVDAAVTTALSSANADVITISVAVFAICVSIAVYKWFRKAL